VCLIPGNGVINFEGHTNLSCPFCGVYSFTSLLNFTRALARCDVGLPTSHPTSDDNICTAFVSNITLSQNNWPDDGM
jgi:hypothetical protein